LLEAVRRRGAEVDEVRLAATIFSGVLSAKRLEVPDSGSTLFVDKADRIADPFLFSIQPRPVHTEDKAAAFKAAFDFEGQEKARVRAAQTAVDRIRAAREAGANLFLVDVDTEDVETVLQSCPEFIGAWLEGMEQRTADFTKRVRLAESVYLALCEALLRSKPDEGAALWRALRETLMTRYLGPGGVEDLVHMAFRAPDSAPVELLRDQLIDIEYCHTDQSLHDLSLAATYNGKTEWLNAKIDADRRSPSVWRRKRAVVLSGFIPTESLPVGGAWPDGPLRTDQAALTMQAARRRAQDACARNWWKQFVLTDDLTTAYAVWILFLRSVDVRACNWMRDHRLDPNDAGLTLLKAKHVCANHPQFKRAIEKRSEKLGETFLGRQHYNGIGPWATRSEHIDG
jgi:hypothetical protein